MKTMVTTLNKKEDDLTQEQKLLLKSKTEGKIEMANKQSQYVNKLLAQFKSWDGCWRTTDTGVLLNNSTGCFVFVFFLENINSTACLLRSRLNDILHLFAHEVTRSKS